MRLAYTVVGSIDFYHFDFIPLSVTLAEGHKTSAKQNLLASFSYNTYVSTGQDEIWPGVKWLQADHHDST